MRIPAIATALLVASLGFARTARADEAKWLTNYDEAVKKAKAEKKVILADFTGSDWCGWCIKLKEEVFDKKEFQDWASKRVVLLEVDFPQQKAQTDAVKKQNADLQSKFSIEGYPTIVFIDVDGTEKGRSGYMKGGPAAWTKNADGIIGKDGDAKKDEKKDEKKAGPSPTKGDATWHTAWDTAVEQAKKENKLIIADFTGSDWCIWCQKLKKEVFDTDDFKKWASEHAVLLELDYPRKTAQSDELKAANKKLKEKYGIRGYPTVLVLDVEGKKIGQLGYEEGGPENWTKKAQAVLDSKK